MNNKLISTNGLWYKLKRFLKKLFLRKENYKKNSLQNSTSEYSNNNYTFHSNIKEEFAKDNIRKQLAEKLLYGEINTSELTETQVDQMIEYFNKDIQYIDSELSIIKKNIISMKQKLNKY